MRKNKIVGKNLEVFSYYKIIGLNLDRLINALAKGGVTLYRVKKIGVKKLFVAVKLSENEKFFAITQKLCYTDIKKIREGGKAYPLLYLARNAGLVFGAIFFILFAFFSSGYVLAVEFKGSGSFLKRELRNALKENGVTEFSRFSDIDLNALSDKLLAGNERLSFVACKKSGNRLIIDSALAEGKNSRLEGDKTQLVSDCRGIVESIKVYRGTAAVKVGDYVEVGDVLVNGYALVKETEVTTGVLASATIVCEYCFVYVSEKDGDEYIAELFAENELNGKEIINSSVIKTETEGKFVYTVSAAYKSTVFTG